MIAVDTNILVYSHRQDSKWHEKAKEKIALLAEGSTPWFIPWPCVHEFLAIVSNQRIFKTPTPLKVAIDQIESWLESPNLFVIGEIEGYWEILRTCILDGKITGPKVHDARIASICNQHGISKALVSR